MSKEMREQMDKFKNLLRESSKENLNMSDIKNLFLSLDFYPSFSKPEYGFWGNWISNQNEKHKIKIEISKNMIYLDMTKNGKDKKEITIDKRNVDLDDIKNQIIKYFN